MPDRLERLIARGATVVGLLLAAYYATLGGEYSIFDHRELQSTLAETGGRVDSLRLRTDSIAAYADSLVEIPLAIERVARERHGFIRDGERLYRFVEIDADDEPQSYAAPQNGGTGTGLDPRGNSP